ncbi:MAG: deoxynucleoside kinase [Clostridia bacterium]|nr:deoxynucleoside kinase [Clostridia bacterium]
MVYAALAKGILLVCEGISGSGKSESIKALTLYLNKLGINPVVVEWNSNNFIRKIVKSLHSKNLLSPLIYSVFQWMSFFIDYFTKFIPALLKGKIVIADRYVYTAYTRDAANGAGKILSNILCRIVRKPDIIIFHDTPPHVCYERIRARGKALFHTNKIILKNSLLRNKNLYYLKKIRGYYIKLFESTNICKDVEVVLWGQNIGSITTYLDECIGKKMKIHAIQKQGMQSMNFYKGFHNNP